MAVISWDAPVAGSPEGILLAPDRDHIYRQRVALDIPPELRSGHELWLALSVWRVGDGEVATQTILTSDHPTVDDEWVILKEFALPSP